MTNTYLLEVIKALQPAERQEMALFLASSYFNRGGNAKELTHLYQIILDAAPEFSDVLLRKEQIYSQVFSDQNMVQGKLEKLMADLNKLLRAFALTQRYHLDDNDEQHQIDWAAWLRERGLSERSRQVLTKLKSQKAHEKIESLQQDRTSLLIAEEDHEMESMHNQAKGDLNIPRVIYHLDLFFHTYRTELLNRYLLQQKAAQLPAVETIETESSLLQANNALLKITKCIHEILRSESPSMDEFDDLMQLLQSNELHLSFSTLAQFYAYLRNACQLMINVGHLEFYSILHEIYKDNLERAYFFVNGEISPHLYLSLVQTATRAQDHIWAVEFTKNYRSKIIGGDEDHFFYRLNMAQCLFAEGKFDEASQYIPDAPSGIHYHRMVRRLELKIYYEIRSDLLLFKLDAFRKFIERTAPKTIAANLREMDLNFLNILLQLTQSPPKDKARSARLVKRIEEKKLLADRAWLLEKARALG
ncbi:MAG: hypothetical protein H7246_16170 [Phycisphaerae bacterium]|nr:hypothetical protein [Saprospiraceae bacterium]